MADPAFDAFSQRRDTGTKDRVTERRRVDTYTDPNRYQMPPRRRLGVHASNKSMFVTPEKENITALAEGLAKVQPDIMGYIADRQIEANKKQIQYGIQEAMGKAAMENGDTEFVDNEWRQFGFEQKKAMMAGEELSAQLAVDVQTKDPMVDFDPWYQDWYATKMEEFPHLATMDPEHLETYNKPVQKGVTAAKNQAIVDKENEVQRQYVQVSTDYTKKTIEEAIEKGYEVNNELIEQIINDEINMSRWGRDKANDIIFNSIKDIAIANNDASLLDYFDERRGDGSIPPVSTMRATEIEAIETTIERNIDAQTRDENAQITADNKFITDNQKLAKDELTIMIGAPEDFGGMEAIDGISPADKARVARYEAMEAYQNIKNQLKIDEGYSEAEAHAEALERVKNSREVQSNLSGAYSESERKKSEAYKSSASFVTSLQENLDDGYDDYVADLYEAQGLQKDGSSVNGKDLTNIIPEWHSLDKDHQKLLLEQGRKASLARRKTDIEQIKKNNTVVDGQISAEGIVPEDNTPVTVRLSPEEDKAFKDMEAESERREAERQAKEDADAGRLDFNEADRPAYDEGFVAAPDDNQGLYEAFETPITDEDRYISNGSFPDIPNILPDVPLESVAPGVDPYTFDPNNPFNMAPGMDIPLTYNPADKKWIASIPDVNTNNNIATVTPTDVSEKNSFKEKLKLSESSGEYAVVNAEGFKGAYQFGDSRLKDFKNSSGKNFTTKQFLKNPKLQDEVFEWHVNDIRQTIVETGTTEYIGKTIKGIPVTMEGLIAVAHLGGKQGMINFVKSNGQKDKQDSNGTKMSTYLRRFSS